ncbi:MULTISPECIES: mandelate racemase/muconate lactonizing enzyme family protein [Dethiosulfovibrio]|uniref:Mandelate racemase/muconate lactonizing enzyme C-terminal domain-containing protein n=2 Tax=Dethiosulfovibrio TaxID=47054 RepID=A0ABS9EM24_9BACT|nr:MULTISPECIES: enolase C-terminal domain-like protein [Dethiosulfovibrio]MCF4113191.1 hypothetical protein [Dethiosulfovibrio russensis]MCF4142255.1 hypothetical protein [Dethiosulfovibrio marinus]MCF4144563.1 hypothetical protein [Dethiosulfovibrio acidaminovorans]
MSRIKKWDIRTIKRSTTVMATSYGKPPQEKEHVIVRVEDEDGVRGWGESTPLPEFSGETVAIVKLVLTKYLLPPLIGMESFDMGSLHESMDISIYGNNASKAAIDTALYDLNAKKLGVPIYKLTGGKYRDKTAINRHIGITDIKKTEKLTEEYIRQGVKSIKIKIGDKVVEDIARVKTVRSTAGKDVNIRVDANGGYDIGKAVKFIRGVVDCDLEMYEQLLPANMIDEASRLRREFGIPLCADEGVHSPADAAEQLMKGAADFITVKLIKTGGIYPALQIAGIAQAAGVGCVIANTFDTQINCAACLHLACSIPSAKTANDLTCYATQKEMADTCHRLKDGYLYVGPEPGIGVRSLAEFQLD